jgi:predicted metal-dependent phosphotriesterase family hydrolase
MLGFTGMGLVVLQMAMLSNAVDSQIVMTTGLFAAAIWIYYALCRKDKWLFLTNVSVGGFAMWGLL